MLLLTVPLFCADAACIYFACSVLDFAVTVNSYSGMIFMSRNDGAICMNSLAFWLSFDCYTWISRDCYTWMRDYIHPFY